MLFSVSVAFAVTLAEAKRLYADGEYAQALPALQSALKAKPSDAALNRLVGVCLYKTGNIADGRRHLEASVKKVPEAYLDLARISCDAYDIGAADEYVDKYKEAFAVALKRARGKNKPKESDDLAPLEQDMDKLRNMMSRVEKIVIIDSMAVDRDTFFEAYKLSTESGSFYSPAVMPEGFTADGAVVYMPESQTSMLWSVRNGDDGHLELMESSLLSDGSWEQPRSLGTDINEGGDVDFPYLMTDGVTMYFANNGENSLGGYDIFISRRGDDNKFLSPQNVGMPYNSPYDDYLLAIDEQTGAGWWATDRNQLGDQITIYKFIPSDLRINYAPDEAGLAGLARVDSYRATWPEGADYTELLETIDNLIPTVKDGRQPEFVFSFPDGKMYTEWDDFHSAAARMLMEQYVDAEAASKVDAGALEQLRRQYASGDRSVSSRILELEKKADKVRKSQMRLINEIIKIEQ